MVFCTASAMTIDSRRREFIAALGGAASVWPFAVRAQQPRVPVIGLISGGSADPSFAAAFRKGLGETGYVQGQNVTVEYHWLDDKLDRVPAVVGDLVRRRVAVIATPITMTTALAAKAATTTIPIVFGIGQDPINAGLIASYNRPGGNATGINFLNREVDGKRLELLHEMVPKAVRIALLINTPDALANTQFTIRTLQETSSRLGLQIDVIRVSSSDEINSTFATLVREKVDALFVPASTFFLTRRVQLATLAARYRIPASYPGFQMVQDGGLMSYGSDIVDVFYQVGIYSGRILNGAKPAEMPVVQPTKFVLAINLKAARLLGITVPRYLLALADELVE
jgi:putative ABC transport system substrate-binding protein